MKIVRSVVKGMFIYSMMWRGSMPLAELPGYVARIGVHRDYNAQFFASVMRPTPTGCWAKPFAQASCALIANAARYYGLAGSPDWPGSGVAGGEPPSTSGRLRMAAMRCFMATGFAVRAALRHLVKGDHAKVT